MDRFKKFIKEPSFTRSTLFIVINAFLLYVLFFIIKNFSQIAGAGVTAAGQLISALSPLFIGLLLAYLLNPLVDKMDTVLLQRALIDEDLEEAKRKRRTNLCRILSILFTYLIAIAAVSLIIYGFAVMLLGQFVFTDITATLNAMLEQLLNYDEELKKWIANTFPDGFITEKIIEVANFIIVWFSDNFSATSAVSAVKGTVGSIINFVIGIIISIYLLKDKEFFIRLWNRLIVLILPKKASAAVNNTLHEVNGVISLFIRGALLDAVFVAILSSIGLSILGLDFAVFIGIFAGIANVIPYFGPVLGMIPAFIMGWLTESFSQGLLAIVILLVVQQIDSNIIYPKVVGSSTGLHPLLVLLAVSVFGYFGGILGMLIAVPCAGVAQVFVKKWVHKREDSIAAKEAASHFVTPDEDEEA